MKLLKPKASALSLRSTIVSVLLSSISIPGFSAGYAITQIPVPKVTIPAGATARPVCLGINEIGQVACNLEIVETLTRTPIDRLAPSPKIFASYAYAWDSITKVLTLFSPVAPTTFDRAKVITDTGFVGGSTAIVNKPSQGVIWTIGLKSSSKFGPGEITDINNPGDYVLNKQLFVNNQAVSFAGKNIQVNAINNLPVTSPVQAAGIQSLVTPVKISGIGLLYPAAPANPSYALTSGLSDYSVSDLSANGNRLVISGTPNTISAATALSCKAPADCRLYFSTVGTSARGNPYIRLNSVDNTGNAVGTDGGFALLIKPPTAAAPNGTRVDLNSLLPAGSFSNLGWFLNEATGINNGGQVVGVGLKGGKNVAFLLTPQP
ncbi:MAG: hypothetical protein WCP96_15150 [Methylococcaceae bacterium]